MTMQKIKINGYQIISRLGEGAMSEVYLAIHQKHGQVAIKILHTYLKDDQESCLRLEKEAESLSRIDSVRIVGLIELTKTEDGRTAIVQEYIQGKNLDVIINEKILADDPVWGVAFIAELLSGIEEAHQLGIIHRDLKPENIMVKENGRIVITDFGIAKNFHSLEKTQLGVVLGSPNYMSPEQFKGEAIDHRSDLFTVGILLYKLLTGVFPFAGDNYHSLSASTIAGKFKSPEMINPLVHPQLSQIIKKALQIDVNERYQQTYEFRADLLNFLQKTLKLYPLEILINREHFSQEAYKKQLNIDLDQLLTTASQNRTSQNVLSYCKQTLILNPDHRLAHTMLKRLQKKGPSISRILVLGLVMAILAGAALYHVSFPPNQIIKDVISENISAIQKETPILHKEPNLSEVQEKVFPEIKNEPEKIVVEQIKKKPPVIKHSFIKFNIDDDITVLLDGKTITQDFNLPVKTSPGRHKITLKKNGFDPITNDIKVMANKTTVINAKTR